MKIDRLDLLLLLTIATAFAALVGLLWAAAIVAEACGLTAGVLVVVLPLAVVTGLLVYALRGGSTNPDNDPSGRGDV